MNTLDTAVAAQIDELLMRSLLRAEHVEELADHQALRADGVLTEMLASIERLTKYRAKYRSPIVTTRE